MQQLLSFIEKRKYLFLFLLIQSIALFFTIQNKDYQRSKFVNSTGNFTGGIYSYSNNTTKYFDLYDENIKLIEENSKLYSMLKTSMVDVNRNIRLHVDTNSFQVVQKYYYSSAEVVNNSYRRRNNHITINKGSINGIENGDGVITSQGIIGVIENVGENYSSVISILNKNLLVNAKLKKSDYFGSLSWPGKNRNKLILSDIPKEADVNIGDTVTTGGFSTIFPAGIDIGIIKDINIPNNHNYYTITISPFTDYAKIKYVYIIHNLHKGEIKDVESKKVTNE